MRRSKPPPQPTRVELLLDDLRSKIRTLQSSESPSGTAVAEILEGIDELEAVMTSLAEPAVARAGLDILVREVLATMFTAILKGLGHTCNWFLSFSERLRDKWSLLAKPFGSFVRRVA
jgi:hypothetical protein